MTHSAKLCYGDAEDNYYVDVPRGRFTVHLTLPASLVGEAHLLVYAEGDLEQKVIDRGPILGEELTLSYDSPTAGRYIVRLYANAWDDASAYTLRVTVP